MKADTKIFSELSKEFSLIPLKGKKPIEEGWQVYCETSRQFNVDDFKGLNAGIPCGPGNGILVVDVDDVIEFNKTCKKNSWTLPTTRMHLTGSSKPHYLYQYPKDGRRYGCRAFKENGVSVFDIRGIGGQIVAPGSIHPDTGKPYIIQYDYSIAEPPKWLLDLACQEKTVVETPKTRGDCNVDDLQISLAVKELIKNGVPKGQRSEAIFSVIQSLLKAGNEALIISVFEKYPIGDKYREKGQTRERWLQGEIARAKGKNTLSNNAKDRRPVFMNTQRLQAELGEKINFLFRNNLFPQGLPSIVSGREGDGKSSNVAAVINEVLLVNPTWWAIWLSTEGFSSDHADKWSKLNICDRLVMLRDNSGVYQFQLDNYRDLNFLDESITALKEQTGGKVISIIIDSIRGMQSVGENDAKMAQIMSRINAIICDKHRASCIYIAHNKKGKTERVQDKIAGSTGIPSSVRAVYDVEKISKYVCKITPGKQNTLGHHPKSYRSILQECSSGYRIDFIEDDDKIDDNMSSRAERFLIDRFKIQSEYNAGSLYKMAELEGISKDTLLKAKSKLPIDLIHKSPKAPWIWQCSLYKQNLSICKKKGGFDSEKPNKINQTEQMEQNFEDTHEKVTDRTGGTDRTHGIEEKEDSICNYNNNNNALHTPCVIETNIY
jgi:hypothetical protein